MNRGTRQIGGVGVVERCGLIILLVHMNSAYAENFNECVYTPKPSEKNLYPELEIFQDCASYESGVLKIAQDHLLQLDFGRLNLSSFVTSGQHFYVKSDGRFLPVIFYDNGADPYQEGLTRSLLNGKVAFYNLNFELVVAPGYDWAWPFEEGKALVCNGCTSTQIDSEHKAMTGGLWGYINRQGEEVVSVEYTTDDVPRP